MAYFDRFDICEAYLALESDYHKSGWLQERPSNRRRMESTDVQLHRIGFEPSPLAGSFPSLTDNGKDIYCEQVNKLGLSTWTPEVSFWLKYQELESLVETEINTLLPDNHCYVLAEYFTEGHRIEFSVSDVSEVHSSADEWLQYSVDNTDSRSCIMSAFKEWSEDLI